MTKCRQPRTISSLTLPIILSEKLYHAAQQILATEEQEYI